VNHKINKTNRINNNRKIVGAITKHLTAPITLSGASYAPAALAQLFQGGIDVADATDAANEAWHAAVAKERTQTGELSLLQAALRSFEAATYGETSTVFTDFGFTPRKVTPPTADTKAAAAKKRLATREARHTLGPRQKAKITGATTPAVNAPPAVAAPPVAPAAPGVTAALSSAPPALLQATPAPARPVASA
jgi:hypothetical protein